MSTFLSDQAEPQYVEGASARFAYRRIGPRSGVPLILCQRLRATIDHWDPALLDILASERDVIMFEYGGAGLSSGTPPDTVDGLADGLLEFLDALDLYQVDLFGWSLGGFVVEKATLLRSDLVRRLIVAGSGPGLVPGMPAAPEKVFQVASKPVNEDEDLLYLFYPETDTARQAGLASLRRLDTRLARSQAAVSLQATQAQLAAIRSFGTGVWDQLEQLTLPVLVANGARDIMISAFASYLFQHAEEFGHEVLRFLR